MAPRGKTLVESSFDLTLFVKIATHRYFRFWGRTLVGNARVFATEDPELSRRAETPKASWIKNSGEVGRFT
jgi:hypothetical protein